MISALWGKLWGYVVAAGAILATIGGIYLKGRSDQKQKTELKDITDANAIRKAGADARSGSDPDKLHDDGWKRD